jgi:hypothetical protein
VDEVEESTVGVVDYEMTKRELNERLLYECRCDERLNTKVKGDSKTKVEDSTRLAYTGLRNSVQVFRSFYIIYSESITKKISEALQFCFFIFFLFFSKHAKILDIPVVPYNHPIPRRGEVLPCPLSYHPENHPTTLLSTVPYP